AVRVGRPVGGGADRRRRLVEVDRHADARFVAGVVHGGAGRHLARRLDRYGLRVGATGNAGGGVAAGEGHLHVVVQPAGRVGELVQRVADGRGRLVHLDPRRVVNLFVAGLVDAPVDEVVHAIRRDRHARAGDRRMTVQAEVGGGDAGQVVGRGERHGHRCAAPAAGNPGGGRDRGRAVDVDAGDGGAGAVPRHVGNRGGSRKVGTAGGDRAVGGAGRDSRKVG